MPLSLFACLPAWRGMHILGASNLHQQKVTLSKNEKFKCKFWGILFGLKVCVSFHAARVCIYICIYIYVYTHFVDALAYSRAEV